MKKLTTLQLKNLKNKLLEEKRKLLLLGKNSYETILERKTGDEVDSATTEYFRNEVLRFRNRDILYLKKVEKSLEKFEKEEFGICISCGEGIKYERLLARPTAECCIHCKEKFEFEESQNFFEKQTKSLGSTINFHDFV